MKCPICGKDRPESHWFGHFMHFHSKADIIKALMEKLEIPKKAWWSS